MREISVRYKQAVIGVLWVVLQPLIMTAVFTFVFSYLARVPSDGAPYPVFVFSGQLLWQFFARSVTEGSASLVSNKDMITKVYFPRQILPITIPISAMIDTGIAFVILYILCLFYGIFPGLEILVVPFVLILMAMLGYGISLWTAPLNAIYRDIGIALPFVVQIMMFLTPVIYPVSFVPEQYQWIFYLNPMATLIEINRWAFLGTPFPAWEALAGAVALTGVILYFGFGVFRKLETTLIDRI